VKLTVHAVPSAGMSLCSAQSVLRFVLWCIRFVLFPWNETKFYAIIIIVII